MTKSEIKLKETIRSLRKERNRYRSGFFILYEYYDSIYDDEKPIVNRKLNRLEL